MGKTFAEKILSLKAGKDISAGEIVTISPDYVMSHDNAAAISREFMKLGLKKVKSPEKIVIILDHVVPPSTEQYALNHKIIREFVKEQNISNFYDINRGVCHQVFSEEGFALPGKVILGSDSHTTTYGAFGAFSAGIGRSEVAVIWATDEIWLRVPETIKIIINGKIPKGVYAKDIILYLIGRLGADGANYKAVEFAGDIVKKLSVSSRMVIANMSAEMGAKIGYFEPDEKTLKWIDKRAKDAFKLVKSDPNANYEDILEFEISNLTPQIACPHSVDNVKSVEELEGKKFNEALIGTCTNGRIEDLEIAAKILEGRKIHPEIRALIFPASSEVLKEAVRRGFVKIFLEAGCIILNPGCGPCLGAHEGVLAPGEVALSTANRNFKGRMGSRDSEIYLASPATVAASAIGGKITDPRRYL
jgi:homoaconitate hydratase family protein